MATATADQPRIATDAGKILVLESNTKDSSLLVEQLKQDGCHVTAVESWQQASESLQKTSPGLVLCDLSVVDEQGCPAIETLATSWSDIAVIALAREVSTKDAVTAMRCGALDCLNKPVTAEVLRLAVSRALEHTRLRAENRLYREELEQANGRLRQHLSELELDQRAGRSVQMSMLPPSPLILGQYRLMHQVMPSLFLSGDFVDYFQITKGYLAFYVADVSGHGAASAFITVLLKNFSRRFRREYIESMLTDPAEVLAWLNQELMEQQLGRHVSFFLGILNMTDRTLYYANAGHFPNPMLAFSGGVEVLELPGRPLGLFKQVDHKSNHLKLPESFTLTLFTDGVLEVMPKASLEKKEARLVDIVSRMPRSIDEIWNLLDVKIPHLNTSGGGFPDDVCCLLLTNEILES